MGITRLVTAANPTAGDQPGVGQVASGQGIADPELQQFEQLEVSLRPQTFAEVIGRAREKQALQMMISASRKGAGQLDHILFHGPPGLGKTSLAGVVARELGANFKVTSGPALERQGDLAALLTGLEPNTVLFIDEIHRLRKPIEEILYPAMEDSALDILVGKGTAAKSVRLELPPLTIVGATTRVGLLSKPLRDRFGIDFRLDYYELDEMVQLVQAKAKLLQLEIVAEAAELIAHRARRTPRIALKLLKRVRDQVLASQAQQADPELTQATLELLDIDQLGLDYLDKLILRTIIEKFSGGPVGLNTLAAAISEEVDTISDVYEPFLLREGLIERTPRGRKATPKAYQHLGLEFGGD